MITVPLINWQPMPAMPDDRKDGRQMLIWNWNGANVATWTERGWDSGYASEMDGDPLMVEDAQFWADINPPVVLSGLT